MNVIVAMGNTSNAEASIRQQKLSILSLRGKKGSDGRNHRPLFNEDKNMLKPGLMMAQVGQKSRTFLGSKIVLFWCAKKAAMEYPPPLVEKNYEKPATTCHLGIPRLQAHF